MKRRKSGEDSTINCPRCNRPNPVELIYCAALDCAAVLHPGRITCGGCRAAIPFNARFCSDCGHPTGYRSESEEFTDRRIRSDESSQGKADLPLSTFHQKT